MEEKDYEDAIERLAQYLGLSQEAINIAEGWSLLPETVQRHVKILIDDHITNIVPQLKPLYAATSHPDQLRFNRVIERVQSDMRRNDDG